MNSTLFDRMFRARPGQEISWLNFVKAQTQISTGVLLLAIGNTKTRVGAERIYQAEMQGRKRQMVLQRASRRLDWFDKREIFLGNIVGEGLNNPKETN